MVVFEQKRVYSSKSGYNRQDDCFRAEVVVFEQKLLYSGKVVLFRKKWLYSEKGNLFEKV